MKKLNIARASQGVREQAHELLKAADMLDAIQAAVRPGLRERIKWIRINDTSIAMSKLIAESPDVVKMDTYEPLIEFPAMTAAEVIEVLSDLPPIESTFPIWGRVAAFDPATAGRVFGQGAQLWKGAAAIGRLDPLDFKFRAAWRSAIGGQAVEISVQITKGKFLPIAPGTAPLVHANGCTSYPLVAELHPQALWG